MPEVRTEAARALGVTGESNESVEPLVAALDDSSAEVRRAATLALGRIPDSRAVEALVAALGERPELWREASAALAAAADPDLLDRLVPFLDSESSHVRSGADSRDRRGQQLHAASGVRSPSSSTPTTRATGTSCSDLELEAALGAN